MLACRSSAFLHTPVRCTNKRGPLRTPRISSWLCVQAVQATITSYLLVSLVLCSSTASHHSEPPMTWHSCLFNLRSHTLPPPHNTASCFGSSHRHWAHFHSGAPAAPSMDPALPCSHSWPLLLSQVSAPLPVTIPASKSCITLQVSFSVLRHRISAKQTVGVRYLQTELRNTSG